MLKLNKLTYDEKIEKNIIPDNYELYNDKDLIKDIHYFWFRDFYCARVILNPIRFSSDKNELRTLTNIKLEFSFSASEQPILSESKIKINNNYDTILQELLANAEIAEQFRSQRPEKVNIFEWIDFSKEYLKIGIAEDGIYRLSKKDLTNFGVPAGSVDPKTYKVFLKGNEIPIYVEGEDNGIMEDDEFIEFYGHKNYGENYREINSVNAPYNEYMDRYTDTTVYWLSWNGEQGERINTSEIENIPPDTLYYHKRIDHYESNNRFEGANLGIVEEQNPEWNRNETWFNTTLFYGSTGSVLNINKEFVTYDRVPGLEATILYKVIGYAAENSQNTHKLSLQINDYPVQFDTGYFNRNQQKLLRADISNDELEEGENTLSVNLLSTENTNSVQLDWYDVEYYRHNLFNDKEEIAMLFDQQDLKAAYVIPVDNVTSDNYLVYKNENEKRLERTATGNSIFIEDSLTKGDKYYVSSLRNIKSPKIYYKKSFEDMSAKTAEYLIISHPVFDKGVSEYLEFIKSNYDLSAQKVNVFDLYDFYNYGLFSPEAIKIFFEDVFERSETIPDYLMIAGDANYDYHNYSGSGNSKNYVPSYGHPVSDYYYVIADKDFPIPQIHTGRLPIKNSEELSHFMNKHQNYISSDFDKWNKSFLLISGGANAGANEFSKSVNDRIKNELVIPRPIGGYFGQLYSTENPKSNFGPFSAEYVDSLFDAGGVIISYIGHSGTRIWDNGIEDPRQLKNNRNKNSFITDFGCSTGKFAEPDYLSFSEAFVNGFNGQAIGYISNSSLGFFSTSGTAPYLFYEKILKDREYNIGKAHTLAKIKLLNEYGSTSVNKVFALTNTLIGDPVINLKLPAKPNLKIAPGDIILPAYLDENLDTIETAVGYRNLGLADSSIFKIEVKDEFANNVVFRKEFIKNLPLNEGKFWFRQPIKSFAGLHNLSVKLDAREEIDEIYENDNSVELSYNVLTSSLRALTLNSKNNISHDAKILFLNPSRKPEEKEIQIEIDTSSTFSNPQVNKILIDSLLTPVQFNNLKAGMRYFYRASFPGQSNYFGINSFIFSPDDPAIYSYRDKSSFENLSLEKIKIKNDRLQVTDIEIPLFMRSDRTENLAKVEYNNIDYATNQEGCGHHVLVIDPETYEAVDFKWANAWSPIYDYSQLIEFLKSLDENTIIAVAIGGGCGGSDVPQELRDIYKQFGSEMADQISWQTSWIFLGQKGAAPGTRPEFISKETNITYDTTFVIPNSEGKIITEEIGPVGNWKNISFNFLSNYPKTKITPILNSTDSLETKIINDETLDLSFLNDHLNEKIKFNIDFDNSMNTDTLTIDAMDFDFDLPAELHINYELVEAPESIGQGEESMSELFCIQRREKLQPKILM